MAAGDAFTSAIATPYIMIPITRDYHNIITPSESMKKEYLNMAATPIKQWEVIFKAATSAVMNSILTHYDDQSAGYYEFSLQVVPSYVNSGSNITGHWVDKSWRVTPNSNKWDVRLIFEKSN